MCTIDSAQSHANGLVHGTSRRDNLLLDDSQETLTGLFAAPFPPDLAAGVSKICQTECWPLAGFPLINALLDFLVFPLPALAGNCHPLIRHGWRAITVTC